MSTMRPSLCSLRHEEPLRRRVGRRRSGCLFGSTVLIVIRAQFDGGAITVRVTAREVAVRPPAVTMTLT